MQTLSHSSDQEDFLTDVAVIGISCKLPGAENVKMFWENLIQGLETIHQFTKEELKEAGISEDLLSNPNYVTAKGILKDIELFDANFFGYNSEDAKLADPQHRLFIECAWEALENAGYAPEKYQGQIGVYASMSDSLYLQNNLLRNKNVLQSFDWVPIRSGTCIGALSTQVSYRFNLTGPSVNIATACSSALVTIATACRALVDYDCDLAIAGAVTVSVPQKAGYLYQEGGIESPDGHCKAFDADAKGTVFGNGLGVLILKRLQDAIQDNDSIYAVIKGWALNNDGADKVGFTAPSVNGQANCISSALAFANVSPESISYVETHGTGTAVGDPIEFNALMKAFNSYNLQKQYCAIGSVKTNIGHIDTAAGMAGIIKTILALKHKMLPATLHYRKPNPKIDFTSSPFYVNAELKQWDFGTTPRRAGVNASGIGGTNAFVVLEEFPETKKETRSRSNQILLLSAKTKTALEKLKDNLIEHLTTINTENDLADVAFTLQVGRTDFTHRRAIICESAPEAISKLRNPKPEYVFNRSHKANKIPRIVFMFSGQGVQYMGMAKQLYHLEPEFSKWINHCCALLHPEIKEAVYSLFLNPSSSNLECNDTLIVQPALFILEYSLAKFFIHLGIKPDALIGHSIGEYVAATLADVMTLEEGLKLICQRGMIMAKSKPGAMIAIQVAENELFNLFDPKEINIAAINSPTSCVVSGEANTLLRLENELKKSDIVARLLRTSHAFHSYMMDPILDEFSQIFDQITLKKPNIPIISNLTGYWINGDDLTDRAYWVKHLRSTVKFSSGIQTLINEEFNVFIEVGPGKTLTHFVKEQIKNNSDICVENCLPGLKETFSDQECFLSLLGRLWTYGTKINWSNFYQNETRRRVALPTYPFERKFYWVNPDNTDFMLKIKNPYHKWFYAPYWERSPVECAKDVPAEALSNQYCWLLLCNDQTIQKHLENILSLHKQRVITIFSGKTFVKLAEDQYSIDITRQEDYQQVVKHLLQTVQLPIRVLNLFPLTKEHNLEEFNLQEVQKTLYLSFYSTLFLTQSLIEEKYGDKVNILMVGNEIYSVLGYENVYPAKATVTGPCLVIPQEHPTFKLRTIDVLSADLMDPSARMAICSQMILDVLSEENDFKDNIIAYRNQFRWLQVLKPIKLKVNTRLHLRPNGVYLFTGGLGGISLTIAKIIAKTSKSPALVLFSRSEFPKEEQWQNWLNDHGKDNKISKKILKLQELKMFGAKPVILQIDINDFEQVNETIAKVKNQFGSINGVIHAAGIAGGGLVQLKTVEIADKVLAPKVNGTYILTQTFRHDHLDFLILCSSVSSIVGELSQVDYCSANACLDAFVQTKAFKNIDNFAAINWNTWREVGMAVDTEKPANLIQSDKDNDISPEEGANIFIDVLNNAYRQVIVSTFDINDFIGASEKTSEATLPILSDRNEILGEEQSYVPPTNTVEIELVKIWQNLLGIDKVGINDDFVALGGHSLMALRLLTKIEKKFNTKVSLQILQETKVIKNLAKKIGTLITNKNVMPNSIVTIRSMGDKPILFCLHPVGGTAFCYVPLAKHLVFDCPIYGVQDPSLEANHLLFNSMEQMAEAYIEMIQKVQPHGPYWLCGLSFGATLAVEIGRQLVNKGESIKPIILFDGWAKFSDSQYIEEKFKEIIVQRNMSSQFGEHFSELCWQRMKLLLNYQMPIIKNKLILFKAEILLPEYREIDESYNYWKQYAEGNIEVHKIPGDHETILDEPNVSFLADRLNITLRMMFEGTLP